jgi:sugar/nucleoside kinase (ribokinase family)
MMIIDSAAQQKAVTPSRISLSGVHERFGELEVLKGVDIDVEPGEAVVLIGASGSAGDAFAAGYLAAVLEGRTAADGLRPGHLVAAATFSTREDVPTVLARDTFDRNLALDGAAWSALRLI